MALARLASQSAVRKQLRERMIEPPANQSNAHYIGTYQITGPLGEGGFGKVFAAYQPFLDRQVAIKTVRPELLDLLEQPAAVSERLFINEGRAIARLRHPNIVVVYEFGVAQDSLTNQRIAYMVMEYLPGPSLGDRLVRETIPVDKAIDWIEQIADGLTYAHAQNVVHRDLKPSNVLFSAAGQPVIVDFGLSWLMEEKKPELPSSDGEKAREKPPQRHPGASTLNTNTIGTPKYMAPEQVNGGAATSDR